MNSLLIIAPTGPASQYAAEARRFATAHRDVPPLDGTVPDFIEERRNDDRETLGLTFRTGAGREYVVTVPYVDRKHPDRSEAARLTRQRAKITLRWHAAGQDIHRLRIASACRTLGITGDDRAAVSRRPRLPIGPPPLPLRSLGQVLPLGRGIAFYPAATR